MNHSAPPGEQFFATRRRLLLALFAGCFIAFGLFSERRPLWPASEQAMLLHVEQAVAEQRLFPGTFEPARPPLYGLLCEAAAGMRHTINRDPMQNPATWTIRLPAAVSATLIVLAVFWIGQMLFTNKAAFFAAAVAGLNLGLFRHGRWPQYEVLAALAVCLSMGCWVRARRGKESSGQFILLFYIFAAAGALAGGAAGFLIPMLSALALRPKPSHSARSFHALGTALFLFILITYILLAQLAQDQFGLDEDLAGAFLWKSHLPSWTLPSLKQFFILGALDWMPWLILLPFALSDSMRPATEYQSGLRLARWWLLIAVLIAVLAAGSMGGNLILAWPAAALLIGVYLQRLMAHEAGFSRLASTAAVGASLATAGIGALLLFNPRQPHAWIAGVFELGSLDALIDSVRVRILGAPLLAGGAMAAIAAARRRPLSFFWNLCFGLVFTAAFAALFILPGKSTF